MKLISFIVGRYSFGIHLARSLRNNGRTFVGWRRAERPRMRLQGKLVSCDALISRLFGTGEAEKRNSPASSLSGQAEPTKPPRFVEKGARTEYAYVPEINLVVCGTARRLCPPARPRTRPAPACAARSPRSLRP